VQTRTPGTGFGCATEFPSTLGISRFSPAVLSTGTAGDLSTELSPGDLA
jgi:hypothetical protein